MPALAARGDPVARARRVAPALADADLLSELARLGDARAAHGRPHCNGPLLIAAGLGVRRIRRDRRDPVSFRKLQRQQLPREHYCWGDSPAVVRGRRRGCRGQPRLGTPRAHEHEVTLICATWAVARATPPCFSLAYRSMGESPMPREALHFDRLIG